MSSTVRVTHNTLTVLDILFPGQTLKAKADYEEIGWFDHSYAAATFQYKLGVVEAILGNYIKAL